MKKVKKKFRKVLFVFYSFFLLYVLGIVIVFLAKYSFDTKLLLLLLVSFLFLIVIFIMRPKMKYYEQLLKYLRLKENSNNFTKIKQSPFSPKLLSSLKNEQFKNYSINDDFVVFYKTLTSKDNKIAKNGLLHAFIFIKNSQTTYDDPNIAKAINYIEDHSTKENRFINYSLVMFKKTNKFNNNNIEQASVQVRFEKHGRNNITVIPTLFNIKTKEIFYLDNKKYVPSKFYAFTLDLINLYLS